MVTTLVTRDIVALHTALKSQFEQKKIKNLQIQTTIFFDTFIQSRNDFE